MGSKPKTDILIKATFSNAHGEEMFSSQTPLPEDLANKSDLIIEFTLNSQGIQRQGRIDCTSSWDKLKSWVLQKKQPSSSCTWAYPLEKSLPASGDKIGNLAVEVVDKKGETLMGGSCDVFGKVAEGAMIFEEHLIVGGENRHNFEDWQALIKAGSPRLVRETHFNLKQG